jgi:L-ribulose-5-phosphate 3-epimerase
MAVRRYYCNTSGFPHHRLPQVLEILQELGFAGVSLTLDLPHADLLDPSFQPQALAAVLRGSGLGVTIETGGRFVLDPWRKHWPTLLDAGVAGERRMDFYRRALDLAELLGAPLLSLWSGARPGDTGSEAALERLCQRLELLLAQAAARGVRLALEPEPGMFIESLAAFEGLADQLGSPHLGLTCDLGHLHCTETPPYPELLRRHAARLINVHVADVAGGVHEHLELGRGEVEHGALLATLDDIGYQGPLSLELSRSGHRAPQATREAITYLRRLEPSHAGGATP